jgi:hypothetical protein
MPYSQPGSGDVHVDRPLTQLSIAYLQKADSFVSDRVFPVVNVKSQSDLYFLFDKGDFFRDEMELNAPGAVAAEANYKLSTASYRCDVWKLAKALADQVRANYDSPLQADREMTEFLTLKGLIRKEKLFASTYFTASIWTGDQTGVTGTPSTNQFQFWNEAASTPIEDIRLGKRTVHGRTGYNPNKLVLGREVYDALLDHPDIVGRLDRGQTSGPAIVMKQNLAALFELEEILVMDGIENTAAEGATDVLARIGGKTALLVYAAPAPGLMAPSGGYTFAWTGLLGSGALGTRMRKMRDDRAEADRLEITMAFTHSLVSADLGQFYISAVA